MTRSHLISRFGRNQHAIRSSTPLDDDQIRAIAPSIFAEDKHNEVDLILDIIGEVDHQDHETGVIYVKRDGDGKILKVANLVDDSSDRDKISNYLRTMRNEDDMDIIIALGMAKEGFDWPPVKHWSERR